MKTTKILYSIILILMFLITFISNTNFRRIAFSHESSENLLKLNSINLFLAVLFLVLIGIIIFKIKITIVSNSFLLLLFIFWLYCGRTIGFTPYPQGRLNYGWYIFESNIDYLCSTEIDCESILHNKTNYLKLKYWRININNENINKVIFIGPFTWCETVELLDEQFGD